ncbi:MAG: polyprenyl synthetase family protein [Candidatus Accumulibacter sp.]|jgi:farnesyl diphosphate synthase|nr:polyprenyl synthetase family protein [Accumulibacter sp.]
MNTPPTAFNPTPAFDAWMGAVQERVERALARHLPSAETLPARLHQAMRYACLNGGKRVRPLLAFATGEICAASDEKLEIVSCALEMIHAYSLAHDDLPCMDNDVLRRGRPTCHVEYGESTALLAGDALQTQAFLLLADTGFDTPSVRLEMLRCLARASGSLGMAGGQAIDLDAVGRALDLPELELMHALKTGALIRAAVMLGALCGQAVDDAARQALDRFAKRAGLLFQVVDDILDCTASTATLGKTAGKDSAADKPTYVGLMGLERAREFAAQLREQAIASLSVFGERARRLVELTDFIAHRRF